jgi:hypothetical protein
VSILDRAEHVHGTHCPLEVESKTKIGSKEYKLTVGATRIADTILARDVGVQNPVSEGRLADCCIADVSDAYC